MKCPSCGQSQKQKEGSTCTKCSYRYAFEPRADGIADGKFKSLIAKASANDTYYFTFNQLYTAYAQLKPGTLGGTSSVAVFISVGAALAALGLLSVPFLVSETEPAILAVVGVFVFGVVSLVAFSQRTVEPSSPDPDVLARWVAKWRAAGHPIDKLIETPSLGEKPHGAHERDLFDYGAERLIVTEQDLLVDLLVKNGFHAEQRAIIIAESGYPRYLIPQVQRLLSERPDLPVMLMHDATPHGAAMVTRMAAHPLFRLSGHRVIDAGLFPADVPRIKLLESTVPSTHGNRVPIDALPTAALVTGLAGAFATGALMSPSVAAAAGADGGSSSGAADFG